MHTITPTQCQCARVLLKWDQNDLATRCGLHVQTICLFETEQSTPTRRTLDKITTALENAGVEFLEGDGVKKKTGEIQTLHGADGFKELMNDVYETALGQGGKILILNGTTNEFIKWLGQDWYDTHAKRMYKIKDKYDFRIVAAQDGDEIAKGFAQYRWIDKDMFYGTCLYIYGSKVAFINFEHDNLTIELINRSSFSRTFQLTFEYVWNSLAHPPPQQ